MRGSSATDSPGFPVTGRWRMTLYAAYLSVAVGVGPVPGWQAVIDWKRKYLRSNWPARYPTLLTRVCPLGRLRRFLVNVAHRAVRRSQAPASAATLSQMTE